MTNITTGVMNPNVSASEWFWEESYIDPYWEDYKKEWIREAAHYIEVQMYEDGCDKRASADEISDVAYEEAEEKFDNECHDEYEESDRLYGDWKLVDGKYEPDETGAYAAIYRGGSYGSYVLQVVWSKYAIKAAWCSPCYPNQTDVETEGEILGFILPPDLLDEKWYKDNKHRIHPVWEIS